MLRARYRRSAGLRRPTPRPLNRREEGIDLVYLGQAHLLVGEIEQASNFYKDALEIFQELNDRLDEARALQGLAEVENARGHLAGDGRPVSANLPRSSPRGKLHTSFRSIC